MSTAERLATLKTRLAAYYDTEMKVLEANQRVAPLMEWSMTVASSRRSAMRQKLSKARLPIWREIQFWHASF